MSIPGALQEKTACYYEGKAYSVGAVAHAAAYVEMTCQVEQGDPLWVRAKREGGFLPGT